MLMGLSGGHLLRSLLLTVCLCVFASDATSQLTWVQSPVNGHWYHHTPWVAPAGNGDAYAQTIGGRSLTIRNQEEDDWIRATFGHISNNNRIAWTGLTDNANEGTLEWESGEPVTFTNFANPPDPSVPGAYWTILKVTQNPTDPWWDLTCPSCYQTRILVEVISDDCDANGLPDAYEIADGLTVDSNGNGVPDHCEDCNGNGIADVEDISTGASSDCNLNLVPDECDISDGTSEDCNENFIPDECDIAAGTSEDFDSNGHPDECKPDCDGDGIPDGFELALGLAFDCNSNLIPDNCDITDGTSPDCDANGIPDECDLAGGVDADCDGNGVLDVCDVSSGAGFDCNGNLILDFCDIRDGNSTDCDGDGVPDECQPDCNENGIADSCECHVASYCPPSPNSVGAGALIDVTGIPSISCNEFDLDAVSGPPNQPGLVIYGLSAASQPFGEGTSCVSRPSVRVGPPVWFTRSGHASKELDMATPALSSIQPADTRHFQLWYRDPQGGPFGFNLSNGLEVTFCP